MLLEPVELLNNAYEPIARLFPPVLEQYNEQVPIAMLWQPLVEHLIAPVPMAIPQPTPQILTPALKPIATLPDPGAPPLIALLPIATFPLFAPLFSSVAAPNAILLLPLLSFRDNKPIAILSSPPTLQAAPKIATLNLPVVLHRNAP